MPTPPTRAWNEADPADTDNLSAGAGEIRDEKVDVRERLVNGGHYIPNTNDALSGIHAVAAGNAVANEWAVYNSARTSRLFKITDIQTSIITATTSLTGIVTILGSLTVNASNVVVESKKRRVSFFLTGGIDSAPQSTKMAIYIPVGWAGGLTELSLLSEKNTNQIQTIDIIKVTPTWVAGGGDEKTNTSPITGGVNCLTTTLTLQAGDFGVRSDAFNGNQTFTGGEVFYISFSGTITRTGAISIQANAELTY